MLRKIQVLGGIEREKYANNSFSIPLRSSRDKYYTGSALVTGITRSATTDGLVEASYSVKGTGALTLATA